VLAQQDEFFHGRSLVGPGRELRVAERCLTEDLGCRPDTGLEDIQNHEIVRALVRERRGKDIGRPLTGLVTQLPAGVLAHGHDHRGATWFDEQHDVVWLMAYRRHRSGEPDDFFPWVQTLDSQEQLFPTDTDYERLELERADPSNSSRPLARPRGRRSAEHKLAILATLVPAGDWVEVDRMPSRALQHTEQAYQFMGLS
jgi:hypothetical protein